MDKKRDAEAKMTERLPEEADLHDELLVESNQAVTASKPWEKEMEELRK